MKSDLENAALFNRPARNWGLGIKNPALAAAAQATAGSGQTRSGEVGKQMLFRNFDTHKLTNASGKSISARLVSFDGAVVTMRSKGKTFRCPLSKLSFDSQMLVKSLVEFQASGS
ncbi:MAG: hypothetical protein GY899_04730 [Verrucomicrobiaceae bacterium]|nr:hypothetical protein [Verrucomicrobiaceae bacterium]